MFPWRREKINSESSSTVSRDGDIQKQIHQIQALCGVTQADFQALYITTIERFIEFIAEPNKATDWSELQNILASVVLALKRRQGYLLPLGTDSEISFREREEWTYAVFMVALLKSIDVPIRGVLAKALLPAVGFSWLHRNTKLFQCWQCYLQGDIQQNIFSQIVDPVSEANISNREGQDDQVAIFVQESKSTLSKQEMIQEIDLPLLSQDNPSKLQAVSEDTEKGYEEDRILASASSFQGADFWSWLKKAVMNQTILINQSTGIIHRVEAGFFIRFPDVVDVFLQHQIKMKANDKCIHQVMLKQRPELIKLIKKHPDLVGNTHGGRLHVYCVGPWEARQVISGIVIKVSALLSSHCDFPPNETLTLDPLDNA